MHIDIQYSLKEKFLSEQPTIYNLNLVKKRFMKLFLG